MKVYIAFEYIEVENLLDKVFLIESKADAYAEAMNEASGLDDDAFHVEEHEVEE